MCTLIIGRMGRMGRDLPTAGHVLLAANRDEDPARPSEPPQLLLDHPRIVGGRDAVAGGTWLALRVGSDRGTAAEREPAAVMLLNRPPLSGRPPGRRSRGRLVLDVASARDARAAA